MFIKDVRELLRSRSKKLPRTGRPWMVSGVVLRYWIDRFTFGAWNLAMLLSTIFDRHLVELCCGLLS